MIHDSKLKTSHRVCCVNRDKFMSSHNIEHGIESDLTLKTHVEPQFSTKDVQSTAKRWALGCVNRRTSDRGSKEAEFTQPRTHLLAHFSTYVQGDHSVCDKPPVDMKAEVAF